MKKTLAIIALAVIALAVIIYGVHCYTVLANGTCPWCGAAVDNGVEVISKGNTVYRYTCTNTPWHIFQTYWRVR